MKKHILINNIILIGFLLLTNVTFANIPPWVKGNYPKRVPNAYYKLVSGDAEHLSKAKEQATTMLILDMCTQKGVSIKSETVNKIVTETISKGNKTSYNEYQGFDRTTNIEGEKFNASFGLVDDYYEEKDGIFYYYALYLIANDGNKLSQVPQLSYKLDKGAWRSVIIPGWGQFYQKRYFAGTFFLTGEVVFLSSALYCKNKVSYYKMRLAEANDIKTKTFYKKKSDNYRNYTMITAGVASAWYIYNIIDAFTSKKGKLKYKSQSGRNYTFSPVLRISPYSAEPMYGLAITF